MHHPALSPPQPQPPTIETIGLNQAGLNLPLFEWAKNTGNAKFLGLLIKTTSVSQPSQVGICLHFLAKPSIANLLTLWETHDADAAALKNLATDLRGAPHLLKLHPTVPASKTLATQFYGTVAQHQVLLMLAVRRPNQEIDTQNWFDALRLWTLLQGMQRMRNAPFQDEWINLISEKLRLAADGTNDWLDLINSIRGRIDTLDTVSREVSSQGWAYKKQNVQEKHRDFLNTLGRVVKGDAKPLVQSQPPSLAWLGELDEPDESPISSQSIFDQIPLISETENDGEVPYRQDFGGIVSQIAENASAGQRALTGRGIQLRSAEQLQFLPWSWHTLNPIEQDLLNLVLTAHETSGDLKKRILAWLIRVAIRVSRSMRQVVAITIGDEPREDWLVTCDLRKLRRKPPRRNIRWVAGKDQASWIRPLEDALEFGLPACPAINLSAPTVLKLETLNDLWISVSPEESAEAAFNSLCSNTPGLHRVTSGMTSNVFAGQAYVKSEDAVLAQILAMGPRAGLGGSSAYGSWPSSHLHAVVQSAVGEMPAPRSSGVDKNAAGSELDPLDAALLNTIKNSEARIKLLAEDPTQWIEHHNALVSYVVVALLAATGARPVNDPFESPALFDWVTVCVFLADKVSNGRNGRFAPLVASVFKLLNETYCSHLQTLVTRLPANAELLTNEIALLAAKQESKKLPFFFFLRELPCLSWDSVTERALEHSSYFNWPLPANLMRHRLSIRLRALLLDAEIIDAILGHADQGVMTHGPESSRTWARDMDVALPFLEETYRQLGFAEMLALQSKPPTQMPVVEPDQIFALTKAFGAKARAEARKQRRQIARGEAKKLIKKSVGKIPLESLQPEFWDKLSIDMLTIDGKRPHPNAEIRYELLVRWQTAASVRTKLRLKRLILLDRSFDSVFTTSCVGSEVLLKHLKTWFSGVADQQPLSKTGVRSCLALATLDLVITCQLTATNLLMDVLNKKNFRLVLLADKAYLEYNPLLEEHPLAPVTRYRIPGRCAQWLDKAMDSTLAPAMSQWELPVTWLLDMPMMSLQRQVKVASLIRHVAKVVQQANYLQRPGLVAGYLAGTVPTSALPHPTWVLQDHRVVLITDSLVDRNTEGSDADVENLEGINKPAVALFSSKSKANASTKTAESDDQQAARTYIGALTDLLYSFVRKSNDQELESQEDDASKGVTKMSRRDLATALSQHVKANQATVSSAIWALGHWVVYLAQVHRKKDTPYAIPTVIRYLSALAERFIQMGSDFDLVKADSEEITDFYDAVLEINRDLDLRYVVERLEAFHRYIQAEFKIEDADWDELDCGSAVPHGSPGTLGEEQYANALDLLAPNPESATHERLAGAVLLLLTYRFGLRGADSKGLKVEDLWLHQKMIVIHVQSNELRKLKRPASRRVVPLVEELSAFEWRIIVQFLERVSLCRPDKGTFALFALNSNGVRFDMHALSARINDVLKRISGDKNISNYKARHAFANRISQALIGPAVIFPIEENRAKKESFAGHVAKLLLGTTGPTRRATWALGRLMGHARPRTTFKSYVHALPSWADSWSAPEINALDQKYLPKQLAHAIALMVENLQPWQSTSESLEIKNTKVTVTASVVLSYMRLLRRGAAPTTAARFIGISHEMVNSVQMLLGEVESKIRSRTERAGRAPMQSLLTLISHAEWQSISALCERASPHSDNDGKPVDLSQAITMVSENRQLVMWKESQFDQVAVFIKYFELAEDLRVLQTKPLHSVVANWLMKYIPAAMSEAPASATGVDPVEEGIPPQQIKYRCSLVIRSTDSKYITTGYGMLLLWVIFLVTLSK